MKNYANKQMKTEELQEFFFPKANPPVTIKASSREEAEKLLNKNK